MVIVSTLMALFSVSVKMAIAEMACSVQVMQRDLATFDDHRIVVVLDCPTQKP